MNSVDQFFNADDSLTKIPAFIDNTADSPKEDVPGPNAKYFAKYLARCYNAVLNDELVNLNRGASPLGEDAFRKSLAAFMFRFRKIDVSLENIVVGATIESLGFNLMQLHTLRRPSGERKSGSLLSYAEKVRTSISPVMAMPENVDSYYENLFKNAEFNVKKVAVDDLGVSLDSLLTSGTTVLFTHLFAEPEFSVTDPAERRQGIIDWATEADYRYIIEDDNSTETGIDYTLKSADKHGKVVYLNSFSNLLGKGVSASWMILPDKLLAEYKELFGNVNCQLSYLDQLAFAMFLDKGYMDNYLESLQGDTGECDL